MRNARPAVVAEPLSAFCFRKGRCVPRVACAAQGAEMLSKYSSFFLPCAFIFFPYVCVSELRCNVLKESAEASSSSPSSFLFLFFFFFMQAQRGV